MVLVRRDAAGSDGAGNAEHANVKMRVAGWVIMRRVGARKELGSRPEAAAAQAANNGKAILATQQWIGKETRKSSWNTASSALKSRKLVLFLYRMAASPVDDLIVEARRGKVTANIKE
ncbi:hypothetical protein G7046_g9549 [Stylonectria norvegica]|nr:hypothetical protein G7046_g9549 [Stylonectria norvegica]